MAIVKYIHSRGLTPRLVCQKIGITKQALSDYDNKKYSPNLKTLEKLADGMTALGAPTSVADLSIALQNKEKT